VVLILCAPFLAILVERYLDLPEKTALLILSLAFIATVIGRSTGKGLISLGLGLFAAMHRNGQRFLSPAQPRDADAGLGGVR
jgi:putative tricarboxylic transport membrane protein